MFLACWSISMTHKWNENPSVSSHVSYTLVSVAATNECVAGWEMKHHSSPFAWETICYSRRTSCFPFEIARPWLGVSYHLKSMENAWLLVNVCNPYHMLKSLLFKSLWNVRRLNLFYEDSTNHGLNFLTENHASLAKSCHVSNDCVTNLKICPHMSIKLDVHLPSASVWVFPYSYV